MFYTICVRTFLKIRIEVKRILGKGMMELFGNYYDVYYTCESKSTIRGKSMWIPSNCHTVIKAWAEADAMLKLEEPIDRSQSRKIVVTSCCPRKRGQRMWCFDPSHPV